APAYRRPALLDAPEPGPPTESERARAKQALAMIRATTSHLTSGRRPKPAQGAELTAVDRILTCEHKRQGAPERAPGWSAACYPRDCLDCGKVDLIGLTPEQAKAMTRETAEDTAERAAIEGS